MKTLNFFRLMQTAAVAAILSLLNPVDAHAWSFGGRGSFGSWGSFRGWGSYGGYASYRGYASYGSAGSYGSYGSYGSFGGGSFGSIGYESYGSNGAFDRTFYYSAAPTRFTPEPPSPPTPITDAPSLATIQVSVPENAKVFVDDKLTLSTGSERRYVARGLRHGPTYAYRMRVEFVRDGENVVENKLLPIKAGDAIELDFGNAEQLAEQQSARTELALHVPADAKVTLAGARTVQMGELRNYATSALASGEKWNNYVVHVEVEQNGETLVKEQALTLVGGEKYELTFDFADQSTTLAALD